MEIRKVPAAHGWLWIKNGFFLILRNPILTFVLAGIVALVFFLLFLIPFFGPFLGILLAPALVAGYMCALQASERHEEMEIAHLFAGFGKFAPHLITLGGILLIGVITSSAVMSAIGGEALPAFLETVQSTTDPNLIIEALLSADPAVTHAMLVGILLLLLLSVCLQFTPMLVIFDGVKPLAAIKANTLGVFRNISSYAIYGLLLQVITFLVSGLPFFLSMLLLLPIGMASLYAAYRDIYIELKESPRTVKEEEGIAHND